jgi:lipopolysaccharide export system permease protein
MRLLDRYLLRELMVPLGYCLGGFLLFWISFDLIANLDTYQANRLSAADVVRYYLFLIPEVLVFIMPITFLFALLYALSNHARHSEIIAMRSAGLNIWRIGLPYILVGALLSGLVFYLNEKWVPLAGERTERLRNKKDDSGADGEAAKWIRPLNFKNDYENRIWNIGAYEPREAKMLKPIVDWSLPDGARKLWIADSAEWVFPGWKFSNVVRFDYIHAGEVPDKSQTNEVVVAEFTETPELLRSEIRYSQLSNRSAAKKAQLSIAEIRNYLRLHRNLSPGDSAKLYTQLHGRLAEPWTCFVVALIALPFGAVTGRRNVFVGVANSIFIAFSYFVLLKLGLALGTGGYIPPWLAAWTPNAFFGILGIWTIHRAI